MKFIDLKIPEVKLIEPVVQEDDLSHTVSIYSKQIYEKNGIVDCFVQENCGFAYWEKCFRGIHCQVSPYTQSYLMRCTRGSMLDIALDLRKDSPTYGNYLTTILSQNNHKLLYIPKGCAHACLSLTPDCKFSMKVSSYYEPSAFKCISFKSPELNIDMPTDNLVISLQDKLADPLLGFGFEHYELSQEIPEKREFNNDLQVKELDFPGVKILKPACYEDYRGYFTELCSKRKMMEFHIAGSFVEEEEMTIHMKNEFYGIYYPKSTLSHGVMIRMDYGRVICYIIDMRQDSPTYKQNISVSLSEENQKQLWIPNGYAYAYRTLTENCQINIKNA